MSALEMDEEREHVVNLLLTKRGRSVFCEGVSLALDIVAIAGFLTDVDPTTVREKITPALSFQWCVDFAAGL